MNTLFLLGVRPWVIQTTFIQDTFWPSLDQPELQSPQICRKNRRRRPSRPSNTSSTTSGQVRKRDQLPVLSKPEQKLQAHQVQSVHKNQLVIMETSVPGRQGREALERSGVQPGRLCHVGRGLTSASGGCGSPLPELDLPLLRLLPSMGRRCCPWPGDNLSDFLSKSGPLLRVILISYAPSQVGRQFCDRLAPREARPLNHKSHPWCKRLSLGPPALLLPHLQPGQATPFQWHCLEERPCKHALCQQLQVFLLQHPRVPPRETWDCSSNSITPSHPILVSLCKKVTQI